MQATTATTTRSPRRGRKPGIERRVCGDPALAGGLATRPTTLTWHQMAGLMHPGGHELKCLHLMQALARFTSPGGGDLLQVVLELAGARRVAQLAQRLGLDLADPLAGHVELLTDLLEGPCAAVLEPEAEL
jgi:hypothetical protein